MEEKIKQNYAGERAEYFSSDINYKDCVFWDGESPLKHSKNIVLDSVTFDYKYPLWISENAKIKKSIFHPLGKSGLWYTKDIYIEDSVIESPKEFRRSRGVFLTNVEFTNAAETLWFCSKINLKNVKAVGDYFAMNSTDFFADKFYLDGNYFLDGGKNIEIHNSVLNSKDAFWNCENVSVYDSKIVGEYLGWHSKNLRFVNCEIESDQGLCYIDGLVLENCKLVNSPLTFEYSTKIDANILGRIDSVKNPGSGKINVPEIGELILNPKRCDAALTKIECEKIGKTFYEDPNPNER